MTPRSAFVGLESLAASLVLAGSRLLFPHVREASGRSARRAALVENPMTDVIEVPQHADRTKEPSARSIPQAVRMYVCGPTVYDFAHIGNARAAIVFDVLFRLLRQVYGDAPSSTLVTSPTSTTRSMRARSAISRLAVQRSDRARHARGPCGNIEEDVAALGCLPPTHEPRATAHIAEMSALIERLVARGVAYVAEDHVLFSPSAMDALPGAPRYGSLARRSLDEMLAGARVDVAPYKRDPMDFVLWKPSKPDEPGWPSPCGIAAQGRPGWHIECSAMSMATLLRPFGGGLTCDDPDKNVFDIHGGGIDLVFPHHENEIAQSCCAFGAPRMANVWMHNGFLQVEGEKMSKSLGNFFTIHELLRTDAFGGRSWPGEVLRFAMLRTHYRQPIDWTVRGARGERKGVAAFRADRRGAAAPAPAPSRRNCRRARRRSQHAGRDRASASSSRSKRATTREAAAQLARDAEFLGVDLAAVREAQPQAPGSTRGPGRGSRRWSPSGSPRGARKIGPRPIVCAPKSKAWASR